MLPAVPYCDLDGYLARCKVAPQDAAALAAQYPGYIERRIAHASSLINSRLQKRYRTPLGQAAPPVVATGTAPPPVVLSGRPSLGSLQIALEIQLPGAVGVGTFWWSADGGLTWTIAPPLAASGTAPPAVTVAGQSSLASPASLVVQVTTAGALGTSRFQWSADASNTWNIGAAMAASGTTPPDVILTGSSTLSTPADVQIQVTTAGALGTALFRWSRDAGVTWTTGLRTSATPVPLGSTGLVATFALGTYAADNAYAGLGIPTASLAVLGTTGLAASFSAGTYATDNVYAGQGIPTAPAVVLGSTGLTAAFPPGSYAADNHFAAPTPVPEIALGWLVALVDVDVWQRRGANPTDPGIAGAVVERDQALAELREAADSKEGLFELPTNDQAGDSPTARSVPLSYTEASPFVSADWMEQQAQAEDCAGQGTYGSSPVTGAPWPPNGDGSC